MKHFQIGSNMFNGGLHDGRDLPMILAGHGGGTVAGGCVIDSVEALQGLA